MRPLTPRQLKFVERYLATGNATQAYIDAGYKGTGQTARTNACRLLTNANVEAEIANHRTRAAAEVQITAEWVLKRLVENAERAATAIPVLDKEGNPIGEYRYDGAVVNRALELIGKYRGMFKERVEHSGPGGKPVAIERVESLRNLTDEQLDRRIAELEARTGGSGQPGPRVLESGEGKPSGGQGPAPPS